MKVLIITNMYPSSVRPTEGAFVRREVEAIRSAHPEWSIRVLHLDTIRHTWLYLWGNVRVRRAFDDFRPDVVHFHYGLTQLTSLLLPRRKVVVTLHGSDLAIRWQCVVSRALARHSEQTIVVSRQMLRSIPAIPNAAVIPCGVDTRAFTRDTGAGRADVSASTDRLTIGFPSSRTRPVKDAGLFLDAAKALERRGVQVTVRFLEDVLPEDVPDWMHGCDCVLLTSRREGAPVSLREAACCGVRFVSTAVGDVSEWIGEFTSGCRVSAERDPDVLADCVLACMAEPPPDAERAATMFGIDREVAAVSGIYSRIAASR